jgi:hypothetical protein
MIRAKQARGYALNKARQLDESKGTDDVEMKQQLARGRGNSRPAVA